MEKIARIIPFEVNDYEEEPHACYMRVSEKEEKLLRILEEKEILRYSFISLIDID